MKDSSQQFLCPCRYLWYADFFRGWTMNSSWLLFHFQLCRIPEGLITSRGWAPAALLLLAPSLPKATRRPGNSIPPPPRAPVRAPAANPALCHGAAGGTDPFPGQEVPSSASPWSSCGMCGGPASRFPGGPCPAAPSGPCTHPRSSTHASVGPQPRSRSRWQTCTGTWGCPPPPRHEPWEGK